MPCFFVYKQRGNAHLSAVNDHKAIEYGFALHDHLLGMRARDEMRQCLAVYVCSA